MSDRGFPDREAAFHEIYKPNQMTAQLLIRYARYAVDSETDPVQKRRADERFLLLYDLYIKARSYGILNKTFFWLSLVSSLLVLFWPSLAVVFGDLTEKQEWIKSAVVQTTVTGVAALNYAFYSQYKSRQTYAENLMRHALFSKEDVSTLSAKLANEISKIDKGFSFGLTPKKDEEGKAG
jgi:hypothetical protein